AGCPPPRPDPPGPAAATEAVSGRERVTARELSLRDDGRVTSSLERTAQDAAQERVLLSAGYWTTTSARRDAPRVTEVTMAVTTEMPGGDSGAAEDGERGVRELRRVVRQDPDGGKLAEVAACHGLKVEADPESSGSSDP